MTSLIIGSWTTGYHQAQGALSNLIKAMPVNCFGQPEEIANIVAFLCSD